MTDRIAALLALIRGKGHRRFRGAGAPEEAVARYRAGETALERVTRRFEAAMAMEKPALLPGERIAFLRTVPALPPVYAEGEWAGICAGRFIHERGNVFNVCPDYAATIGRGLLAERERCRAAAAGAGGEQREFLAYAERAVAAVLDLSARYRRTAQEQGNDAVATVLARVPAHGARTLHEALQFFRILHFALWVEGEYHNTVGRFDRYILPYFEADLREGRLDEDGALELIEEFFLTFNRDSDLYPGMQRGDNGQSLMLGGIGEDGEDGFNALSALCLRASRELGLIDPKINLRVGAATPPRVYELGTELTRAGLGFPQYSNDDVVVEGLVRRGYAPADARDYTVAACWEFIVPKWGMDVPNIAAVNLPKVVNRCALEALEGAADFGAFLSSVAAELKRECRELLAGTRGLYMLPAPFLSVMMADCVERRRDISKGARYNNYGFHGVGFAEAVDSLASIKRNHYESDAMDARTVREIVTGGFGGREELLHKIRYEDPQFGDGDSAVDGVASALLDAFADAVEPLVNERGGCVRAGTGSAMYYLWHAGEVGCTPGGHLRGEAFAANYSPALCARNAGPLSIIRSFALPNLGRAVNGGPLTMEFHSTVFSDDESTAKVARLVRAFVELGGHQLQLNAVNLDTLRDAQAHPENHANLIVRVWGWSAYFVELDREYQDHVIARREHGL